MCVLWYVYDTIWYHTHHMIRIWYVSSSYHIQLCLEYETHVRVCMYPPPHMVCILLLIYAYYGMYMIPYGIIPTYDTHMVCILLISHTTMS